MNRAKLAERLKHTLPSGIVKVLRYVDRSPQNITTFLSGFRRHPPVLDLLKETCKLHLGCGHVRLKGFLNVDCRSTGATDGIMDCGELSWLPKNSCDLVYSHAFLEHIEPEKIAPLLIQIREALTLDGVCVMLGMPDFQKVAEAYLKRGVGNMGEVFDLREVFRYTHGDPFGTSDMQENYAQLHKTLFDVDMIKDLMVKTGFASWCVIRYQFKEEPACVSLGFVCSKNPKLDIWNDFQVFLNTNTPFVSKIVSVQKGEDYV